ncbi:helix-turn-helix transcriptional regulator [Chitinophaga sp.]|uniref:helix-turn-helix domain-containing protein n=1 Tax=Chitinophaga sp. TaxID=1869181 RepID=UPI0031E26C80
MGRKETIAAFYDDRGIIGEGSRLFNVFENGDHCTVPHIYNRRDYYKVSLLQGQSRLSWHDRETLIDRPALVFFNPHTPFGWEPVSIEQPGFFCMFQQAFLQNGERNESMQQAPLFKPGSSPVFFLDAVQEKRITAIFQHMLEEMQSDYLYKYDLLRNYLQLLVHEALKITPHTISIRQQNAAERITANFFERMEREFPIDSPGRQLALRAAGDYAQALAVHVNHLNHAVREVTGKSTSTHIADRILQEAKALLRHTDWPVATIANCLGFESPNYFSGFFKKQTGHAPRHVRTHVL